MNSMQVTLWNNGSHHKSGAGYGIKLDAKDRDFYFRREWETIDLELEGNQEVIQVNVAKQSFWNSTCKELIHAKIGLWAIALHLAPWQKGLPPKLHLFHIGGNHFRLSK